LQEKLIFLAVGAWGAALYLFVAWAMNLMGLPPTPSSTVAYALCVFPTYLGQRWFTFGSSQPHRVALLRYLVTQAIGLTLAGATTYFASCALGLPALEAFVWAGGLAASVTYFIQRGWVFPSAQKQANGS
jgi:putative flippase GtrA